MSFEALGRLALGQLPQITITVSAGTWNATGVGTFSGTGNQVIGGLLNSAGAGTVAFVSNQLLSTILNAGGIGNLAGTSLTNAAIWTTVGAGTFNGFGRSIVSTVLTAASTSAFVGTGFAIGSSTSLTLFNMAGVGSFRAEIVGIAGQIPVPKTVVELTSAPVAFLVKFSFASEDVLVWTGFGKLMTQDHRIWSGLGELIRIDGLMGAFGPQAPPGRIVASGVSADLITIARGETSEFVNRPLSIYLQGFDNRRLVGAPVPLALRIMTNLEINRDAGTRTIAINHESPYVGRNRPAAAWYTDRDQQKRFPGDTFCDQTPFLLFKRETWPTY